ncbi:DUF5665 domain-containing protein [Marinicellulosiphila megalodicopiae]|uniref:DUF5665 domain-containing protein n=1 Tax=Marinicellulosiphila megalodicopiae TaxID=2724896 RepID=UPI003BB04117
MSSRKSRKHTSVKYPLDYLQDPDSMNQSLSAIEQELKKISQHRMVSLYGSIFKQLSLQFARGIFFGLGTALGATIVLSGLLFLLAQIEFVPIIGEYVQKIITEIKGGG